MFKEQKQTLIARKIFITELFIIHNKEQLSNADD